MFLFKLIEKFKTGICEADKPEDRLIHAEVMYVDFFLNKKKKKHRGGRQRTSIRPISLNTAREACHLAIYVPYFHRAILCQYHTIIWIDK